MKEEQGKQGKHLVDSRAENLENLENLEGHQAEGLSESQDSQAAKVMSPCLGTLEAEVALLSLAGQEELAVEVIPYQEGLWE